MRKATRLTGAALLALSTLWGCEDPKQPPPTPATPPPRGGLPVFYTKARLEQLGIRTEGLKGEVSVMEAAGQKTVGFPAHLFVRPLTLKPACKADVVGKAMEPGSLKLCFMVGDRGDPTDPCIFQALVGEIGIGKGEVISAEAEDKPAQIGDPMYMAYQGYVIMGGIKPIARGPRSRGAAPGTQFALEIDDVAKVDRYYLLSKESGKKVNVNSILKPSTNPTPLADPEMYIEVDDAGNISPPKAISSTPTDPRRMFVEQARKIADCADLPK